MPHLKVNRALEPILTAKQQIVVIVGGRGSGKSIGIGDILTMKMATEKADVYCLREFQDSINDSVHRVFVGSVQDRLQLDGWTVQENRIIAPNGAYTTYKGAARNPDSMQSAQNYKYSWFEEAHRASQASIDKLLPTILRNPGAKCIFTANPQSSGDPFSQRFITPYKHILDRDGIYQDDLHLILKVNWRDNPWWNQEQENLRLWDFENLERTKYDWIWEGEFNDSVEGSIIKAEWFDAAVDAHKIDKFKKVFAPHGVVVCAHDPSDEGNDSKGICIRHGSIIKYIDEMDTGEIDAGCDWALGVAQEYQADWFVWDGDGMGAGLKGQISRVLSGRPMKTHMYKGSLSGKGQDNATDIYMPMMAGENKKNSKYKEVFKNNRAQYSITLANRFYNTYRCVIKGDYVDPDEMVSIDSDGVQNMVKLRSEVCRVPRKKNNNGLEQIMNKNEMKKLEIESPNMFDSLVMSFANPKTALSSRQFKPQKRRF
jgi:phage terminase large subunit